MTPGTDLCCATGSEPVSQGSESTANASGQIAASPCSEGDPTDQGTAVSAGAETVPMLIAWSFPATRRCAPS